jgi:alginate O-acetyltransferase complex protein AlgI
MLLISSIFFYTWGQPRYIILLIFSIGVNYVIGLLIEKQKKEGIRKIFLILDVCINLFFLGYYKYYEFFAKKINAVTNHEILSINNMVLPIGISFYTFLSLSYIIDVYRKNSKSQKSILDFALYISFFPQIMAGPINKYHEIEGQITAHPINTSKTAYGIKRFIYGLGKKVILANTFGAVTDNILREPASQIGTGLMWAAAILYTLQIYYDFSGYSDMAIGLGKIFGFDFIENFNYPYLADSVQDFWRRWHISLSTWFKEYLYIPLGGNRKGNLRTYINLIVVFFVTGFWHGAGFKYIAWGLFYGVFLVLERMFLGKWLRNNKLKFINHIYSLLIIITAWVIFRADNLHIAVEYIKIMFIHSSGHYYVAKFIDTRITIFIIVGILLSGILQNLVKKLKWAAYDEKKIYITESIAQLVILFVSIMMLVSSSIKSFIYFQF